MTAIPSSAGREDLRRTWQQAWAKARAGLPLTPLEALLADVLRMHPEYHRAVRQDDALARDWLPEGGESNPFLHMGLHVALREGIAANRPAGLAEIAASLARTRGDAHAAEHALMDCLAETLWEAERDRAPPDEAAFLERARRLAGP
jgi:hypothetical protein